MGIRVSNVTSQVMFSPSDIFQTIEQELGLIEEPFARTLQVSNVTFQILQLESGQLASASNTLALTDEVVVFNAAGDRQPVEDVIAFTQTVNVPSNPYLEDVLDFTQTARSSIWNIDLSQTLFFLQYAVPCFGAPWAAIEITDEIVFVQSASKTSLATASNTLSLTDSVVQVNSPVGDGHYIDFVQEVSVGFGYDLSDTLEFTQTIESQSDFLRVITDADVVEHALTYYIDNGCNQKQYARFVGEGNESAIEVEGLIFDASFVLESIEDGTILAIRSPESDDVDRIGFNRINRETRGGELNVYSDPVWAEVNTLLFTITALPDGKGNCPETLQAVLQFMHDNLGEEIYVHDWTGISWRGVITVPDEAATEDADGYWTVTFEFEGIPEDGSVPNSVLNIQQTLQMNADWNRPLSDTLELTQAVTVGGDININVEQTLNLTDSIEGSYNETDIMFDNMASGATSVTLDGQSPDTGTEVWRSHTDILDDGSMDSPIDAGAYYPVTLEDGTVYVLDIVNAYVPTYNNGAICQFGFFEGISDANTSSGPMAYGALNPTCAKAVHIMRELSGGIKSNAYRLGTESDGTADTHDWTDGTLKSAVDNVLDLRIVIDTTGGAGNWTVQWLAKAVLSSTYTEVGPAQALLSENIGAVGWSQDSVSVECAVSSYIRLQEWEPIA